jgi:hypothetical protein
MPKAKPSQVIVHRIELQEKEREMLEAYVGGTVVKNAVVPLSIAAGVGTAGYLAYKSLKAAYGWTEDIVQDIKQTPLVKAAGITPQGRAAKGLGKLASWLFTPME